MTYKVQHFNERDIEIPYLLSLVRANRPKRFLDIGAFDSYKYYAGDIADIIGGGKYTGVDIQDCNESRNIIHEYILGNACDVDLGKHDLVSCISTIEHAGLSTYQVEDAVVEQERLFRTILSAVDERGHFLLTFPFGEEYVVPDQFMNMTGDRLDHLTLLAEEDGFRIVNRFYYSERPVDGAPFSEICRAPIPYDPKKGCQCVGIMIGERK